MDVSLLCNLTSGPLSPFVFLSLWVNRIFFFTQRRKLKLGELKHLVHGSSVPLCLPLCHTYSLQLPLSLKSGWGPQEMVQYDFPIFSLSSPSPFFFLLVGAETREGGLQSDFFHAPPLKKESNNNHKQALISLIYGSGLASCLCIKVWGCIEINTRVCYSNFLIFYLFF